MIMETLITNGIKVSAEPFYQESYSKPLEMKFVFAYRITIENLGTETAQLLRRHWFIVDAAGTIREVEGEGVVGQQPVLEPGNKHQYVSWCPIPTEIGKMSGTFLFQKMSDGSNFEVQIPEFHLLAPFKVN